MRAGSPRFPVAPEQSYTNYRSGRGAPPVRLGTEISALSAIARRWRC